MAQTEMLSATPIRIKHLFITIALYSSSSSQPLKKRKSYVLFSKSTALTD